MLDRFMTLTPLIILLGWVAFFVMWKKSRRFQQFRISWRSGIDDLLVSPFGVRFFLLGVLCVIVYTVVPVESLTNPSKMLYKLLAGIYAITLSIGLLGIFFGMWRYWAKIDDSKKWIKRASFVLLLLGFWWGSAIYCFIVYLPQVRRRQRLEA